MQCVLIFFSLTAVGVAVGLVALIIVICRRPKLQGTHKKGNAYYTVKYLTYR